MLVIQREIHCMIFKDNNREAGVLHFAGCMRSLQISQRSHTLYPETGLLGPL